MEIAHFQEQAALTDQGAGSDLDPLIVPLLGVAGEAGTLLAEYKKRLRDGAAHADFVERIGDDLGDILWYVAVTASRFGLSLNDVARSNLVKTRERWLHPTSGAVTSVELFDEGFRPRSSFRARSRSPSGWRRGSGSPSS